MSTSIYYNKGKKKFGDKAVDATTKELRQIHLRNSFKPKKKKELTNRQKKEALESITNVTEK